MIETAIVGGGLAGTQCASQMADNGLYPTIFDHSHPREKPCGGLISPVAVRLFPFLRTLPISHSERNELCVI